MKTVITIGWLLAASQGLLAQSGNPLKPVVRSASGQFVIIDRRGDLAPALPTVLADQRFFELEPAFLTVSCERIKGALYARLGAPNEWRGKIEVILARSRGANHSHAIVADRFRDGWQYQLNLPQRMERTQFVRSLVQVILLEMANRSASAHSAEVPFWLVEGLTQELLAAREAELILAPPRLSFGGVNIRPTFIAQRENDPLATARQALRHRPPLTIEELSWPKPDELRGTTFQGSAQLFVVELLRLKNGQQSLHEMINGLGRAYNWQTAFLNAFRDQFSNQLAVEKWWALQVIYFVGRDPFQFWTPEESWTKLDEVLRTPVAIRNTRAEMPAHGDVSLQAVIRQWDFSQQTRTIEDKLRELDLTRRRIAPEFMELTDQYRQVLANYLQLRQQGWMSANLWFWGTSPKTATREVLRQLDELDARRFAMRPKADRNLSAAPESARAGVP